MTKEPLGPDGRGAFGFCADGKLSNPLAVLDTEDDPVKRYMQVG